MRIQGVPLLKRVCVCVCVCVCALVQVVAELQAELSRLSEELGQRDAQLVALKAEKVKLRMEVRGHPKSCVMHGAELFTSHICQFPPKRAQGCTFLALLTPTSLSRAGKCNFQ